MAGDRRSVWDSSSVWVWGTGCQGPGLACCPGTPLPLASEPETPSQASSAHPRVSRRAPDGPQLLAPGRRPSRHTPSPPRAPPQDPHHCRLLSPWAGALARLVGPACPPPPSPDPLFPRPRPISLSKHPNVPVLQGRAPWRHAPCPDSPRPAQVGQPLPLRARSTARTAASSVCARPSVALVLSRSWPAWARAPVACG